ncbi:CCA tRNA nucleotidyltransferase 1, mitochondrial isoform X2 [Euwallacea similis]|uniref:CCA tRNA nucleotidyltransferase 1, mitochondrial isoform X2 n=1 Tax=Euwallacea similis TaxID=1736056 RepID=UPI00344FF79D
MTYCCKLKTLTLHFPKRHFSKAALYEKHLAKIKMSVPKSRENPVIMKLETPEFRSLFTDELKSLATLFAKYNYEIRIAGGAVRDLLMGIKPTDLDFATTAAPTEMKKIFESENIRIINENGEKHGTITPRINNKENFEITTLRVDVVTDGRHAEVIFTTDWLLDSLRRDLTINSMFLGLDGSLYDYFFGYDDLQKRRVTFVGNAETRIQEDYLRILRYFRFYGRISDKCNNHDKDTLQAIKRNAAGLDKISGERIWTELKKMLEGNFAGDLLVVIIDCGLSQYIGLPTKPNIEELKKVWTRSGHLNLNAITLLSSLLNNVEDAIALNRRLKLSAFDRDLATFIVEHREPKLHPNYLLPYQQLIIKAKSKPLVIKQYALEVLKYNNSEYLEELETWQIPHFPINGAMLKERGVESGRFMGVVMQELKDIWADNQFKSSVEELLDCIPEVLEKLLQKKKKKNAK